MSRFSNPVLMMLRRSSRYEFSQSAQSFRSYNLLQVCPLQLRMSQNTSYCSSHMIDIIWWMFGMPGLARGVNTAFKTTPLPSSSGSILAIFLEIWIFKKYTKDMHYNQIYYQIIHQLGKNRAKLSTDSSLQHQNWKLNWSTSNLFTIKQIKTVQLKYHFILRMPLLQNKLNITRSNGNILSISIIY